MALAFIVTFKTKQPDHIVSQLRGYKERELDRNPPPGFRTSLVEEHPAEGRVVFRTEWADEAALEDVRDGAPWEACMDLCSIHADKQEESRVAIA